jgi:uncharacterized protein YxjI
VSGPACPSCGAIDWEQSRPPVGAWGCRTCGLHMCPKPSTMSLVTTLGVSPQVMGALATEQSVQSRLRCPSCQQPMVSFDLKGATVEACLGCGITAFRAGRLEQLLPAMPPLVNAGGAAGAAGAGTSSPFGSASPAASAAPGAPSPPSSPAAPPPGAMTQGPDGGELSQAHLIRIKQATKLGEQLGIEQKNDYALDLGMAGTAHISEDGGGVGGVLLRQFMGARRPMSLSFTDTRGLPRYRISRKFYFFLPTVEVTDAASGAPVGRVDKRLAFLARKYDLSDARGQVFSRIHAGFFRVWKFPLVDGAGAEVGAITKKFSGFLKEAMTDSDNFTVEMGPTFTEGQRATALAAAINIDFEYFEKSSRGRGPIGYLASALAFLVVLGFSVCGGPSGGSSGSGGGIDVASYDFDAPVAKARACYDASKDAEQCEQCCGGKGALFRDDDLACICQGLLARCEAGDGNPHKDRDHERCAACCEDHMGQSFWSERWLDDKGQCICQGGFNPSTMGR